MLNKKVRKVISVVKIIRVSVTLYLSGYERWPHFNADTVYTGQDLGFGKRGFVRESGDGSPPSVSRGKTPVGGMWDKSPMRNW